VLYVADTGNNRIQILEKDGAYLDSIGPKKRKAKGIVRIYRVGPSQLNQPTDVAVTTTRVAVADSGNHQVKVIRIHVRDSYIIDLLFDITGEYHELNGQNVFSLTFRVDIQS